LPLPLLLFVLVDEDDAGGGGGGGSPGSLIVDPWIGTVGLTPA
jgi:hypothetical protein